MGSSRAPAALKKEGDVAPGAPEGDAVAEGSADQLSFFVMASETSHYTNHSARRSALKEVAVLYPTIALSARLKPYDHERHGPQQFTPPRGLAVGTLSGGEGLCLEPSCRQHGPAAV